MVAGRRVGNRAAATCGTGTVGGAACGGRRVALAPGIVSSTSAAPSVDAPEARGGTARLATWRAGGVEGGARVARRSRPFANGVRGPDPLAATPNASEVACMGTAAIHRATATGAPRADPPPQERAMHLAWPRDELAMVECTHLQVDIAPPEMSTHMVLYDQSRHSHVVLTVGVCKRRHHAADHSVDRHVVPCEQPGVAVAVDLQVEDHRTGSGTARRRRRLGQAARAPPPIPAAPAILFFSAELCY